MVVVSLQLLDPERLLVPLSLQLHLVLGRRLLVVQVAEEPVVELIELLPFAFLLL